MTYLVEVGSLFLKVRMLNIEGEAPLKAKQPIRNTNKDSNQVLLGRAQDGVEFVSKRFYFAGETHVLKQKEQGTNWTVRG